MVPLAHAVTTHVHIPCSPNLIATCPAAILVIDIGTKCGETLSYPLLSPLKHSLCIVVSPPIPLDNITPHLNVSSLPKSIAESFTASSAAASAYIVKSSIFLNSALSTILSASKPFTSPASLTALFSVLKCVILLIPHLPAFTASHISLTLFPTGVTAPIPVITTLLILPFLRLHKVPVRLCIVLRHLQEMLLFLQYLPAFPSL